MKSIIVLVFVGGYLFHPDYIYAQDFDKKGFCKELNVIVNCISLSEDSMKGTFIGENSLGIQQWDTKYSFDGAISKYYDRSFLETSEEYRATYIMLESVQQKVAEDFYKQMVQAVRWCYGTEYSLSEQTSTEWDNSGKKHQHHEATFTGIEDKGIKLPVILARCFAIESGLYSVTVELYVVR